MSLSLCPWLHYADAADSAMAHFAPLEAARHAAHALALLAKAPTVPGAQDLELRLITTRGLAAVQVEGVASPTAVAALERARVLCERQPPSLERTSVLNALGWVHYARGDFAAARELALQVYEQGLASGDLALQVSGCNLMGVALCNSGGMRESCEWLQRGLALSAGLPEALVRGRFMIDPALSMHANVCMPLERLGLLEAAARESRIALEGARRLRQPMALVVALWCTCMLAVNAGDLPRLSEMVDAMDQAVVHHGLAQGEGPRRWFRGWALALGGDPQAGSAMILQGYECHARLGMYAGCPRVLGYAARASHMAGDTAAALRHFEQALALAARIGETLDVAELLRFRAEVLAGQGDLPAARADLDQAFAKAQAIGADGDLLLVQLARCGLPGASEREREALAAMVARLPPGFDAALTAQAAAVTVAKPKRSRP